MKNKKVSAPSLIWYGVLSFFVVGYILLPFGYTLKQALMTENGYGLQVFQEFFSNENHLVTVKNTVIMGALSVLTCGAIGISLAMYMTFIDSKWKKVIHILLLSPMMIPGVIIVISFIQLYGESGIITKALQYLLNLSSAPFQLQGLGAIIFVITFTQYVYFYLNIYVALKYVDYSTIEAARSMGASWFKVFKDVILPVIMPAILTSTIVTFASGASAFSAPNLIGGGFKVLSTQIVRSKAYNNMAMASVQVFMLFAICVVVMLLIQYYSKRYGVHTSTRSTLVIPAKGKNSLLQITCKIVIAIMIVLIVLPIGAIIYLSFIKTSSIMQDIFPTVFTLENYTEIFSKPRVMKPLINSLKMSAMAVGAGLVFTVPSAYMIVKMKGKLNAFFRALLMLPSTMPASVIAINLINAFNKESVFAFGESLIGGFYILPIAYTITALPLLLSSNEVAIQGLNANLEEASKSLGARMFYTFMHVILPNIAPGIMAGGVLVFIKTIGEYTMSALLYGVYNRPISISMIVNMQEYYIGISMAYGVIVIGICYVALALIFKLDKKRFM